MVSRTQPAHHGDMAAIVVRNTTFFVMVGFAVLEVFFIIGEYWLDPGGVEALIGSVGIVGTILAVSLWAMLSPTTAQYYLWASVGVIVAVAIWWALAPRFVMDVMDERGPLIPVAAIIAAVPIVFWGQRAREFTARAGFALLVVSIAPILGVAFSPEDVARGVLQAVAIMTGPYAVGALGYLAAARLEARRKASYTPHHTHATVGHSGSRICARFARNRR